MELKLNHDSLVAVDRKINSLGFKPQAIEKCKKDNFIDVSYRSWRFSKINSLGFKPQAIEKYILALFSMNYKDFIIKN
jgi:hypothetical protein